MTDIRPLGEPLHVLFVYGNCFAGGINTFHYNLAFQLARLGHRTSFFFFERGFFADTFPSNMDVTIGDLNDLITLIGRNDFDVVHTDVWSYERGLHHVLKQCPRTRLVLTAHGTGCPGWTSKNCSAIVGCSDTSSISQRRMTDLPVATILNAVDTERFRPERQEVSNESPIIGWAGRATDLAIKRIDRFARIADRLVDRGVRSWVATGSALDEVDDVATVPLLRRAVEKWQSYTQDEMPGFFRAIAASGGYLLMTSRWEGLPMVALEAQACGCPVIAPAVGGISQCVSEDHGGILFDANLSDERISQLVWDALADTEARRERGLRCAAFVHQRFGLERLADEYLAIYASAPQSPVRRFVPLRMYYAMAKQWGVGALWPPTRDRAVHVT